MKAVLERLRGRRVLITGHTGFKGSWLSLWLHDAGAEVTGYALAPEGENPHFALLGLEALIDHVEGDVRDLDHLNAVLAETRPEVVIHLAAQALVRHSYDDPKTTYDTNVGGAVNLLEAIRGCPSVKALVFVTSDKCYRNREWVWGYRETDELGGHDPYSASKACAELVFSSYADSFFAARPGFGCASARAGNVIGGGDWAKDRIVPDCMRALIAGAPIVLRNPAATRPWQHVLEPLSGYLSLAARLLDEPASIGGWNFGPAAQSSARTVGELAAMLVETWGSGEVVIDPPPEAPHEARLLHLNTDKALLELGWQPRWDMARTVAETARWYQETAVHGRPAIEVTRAQIRAYEETT